MPWESVTVPLSADLLVHAEFDVSRGNVQEFWVALERLEGDGSTEWIVRYETHGGRAHKHERWDDGGETRHKHPKAWRGSNAELVSQAIKDLKDNFEDYERRYDAWKQNSAGN